MSPMKSGGPRCASGHGNGGRKFAGFLELQTSLVLRRTSRRSDTALASAFVNAVKGVQSVQTKIFGRCVMRKRSRSKSRVRRPPCRGGLHLRLKAADPG